MTNTTNRVETNKTEHNFENEIRTIEIVSFSFCFWFIVSCSPKSCAYARTHIHTGTEMENRKCVVEIFSDKSRLKLALCEWMTFGLKNHFILCVWPSKMEFLYISSECKLSVLSVAISKEENLLLSMKQFFSIYLQQFVSRPIAFSLFHSFSLPCDGLNRIPDEVNCIDALPNEKFHCFSCSFFDGTLCDLSRPTKVCNRPFEGNQL